MMLLFFKDFNGNYASSAPCFAQMRFLMPEESVTRTWTTWFTRIYLVSLFRWFVVSTGQSSTRRKSRTAAKLHVWTAEIMEVERLNEELPLRVSCCPSVAKLQDSQAVKLGAKHPEHQFNWPPVLSATGVCFIGNHKLHVSTPDKKYPHKKVLASCHRPLCNSGIKIMWDVKHRFI